MGTKTLEHKKSVELDEHKLTLSELCDRFTTHVDASRPNLSKGLSSDEAARRLAANGPNQMSPAKTKHPLVKFLEHLTSLFNLLLIVAGTLTLALYFYDPIGNAPNLYAGPILLGVSALNAFIEFYMGAKSEAALRSFMNMIPAKATVVRDGTLAVVPAADLVKGDVVFVRMGDKTPADIRLFKTQELKVDNSSLTGESEPQDREPHNTHESALEANNLAFNSTLVVAGEGYGVVIRTGDDTVIGQIANLTQSEQKRKSPLTEEIDGFVKFIGSIASLTAVIFFVMAQVKTNQIGVSFNFAIGVLVAWVPQGLPATMTMLLTIAAKRMAKQQVLVKDLTGVETLGAITLLATDKTGTLTRNQMTVSTIWTQFKSFALLADSRTLQSGEVAFDSSVKGVQDILNISALCSRARLDKGQQANNGQHTIVGDPTETGLFRLAMQKLPNFDALVADRFPKVLELPFNSDTKWHMTIHKMPHANGVFTTLIKGAPERVLRLCSTILGADGMPEPLTDAHKDQFHDTYEAMASKGHRVLAFAKYELPAAEYPESHEFSKAANNFPMSGLTFVGLASLEDPPKHGVREAVGHCRRAGIKVVMVTGDHPLTAEAIGRKINMMISDTKDKMAKRLGVAVNQVPEEDIKAIVIHGDQIDSLTDRDWDLIFSKEEIIFARTSPKHKLQIVKRAQAMGHIVGVTGDGVNDSPALKKADLGIAMNISGSDVSKEAAAMILLDDNFASIINGIREGRLIFANLKKSLRYVLVHSIPEVIPQLLFVTVPLPVGIGVLPILAIDLGYELFAALSFAWELPESEGLMKLEPRRAVTPKTIDYERSRRQFDNQFKSINNHSNNNDDSSSLDADRDLTLTERLRRAMSLEFWRSWAFSTQSGERMVDADSLSWMYLEAGVIQYIGAQITFFVVFYFYVSEELKQRLYLTPTDLYDCANYAQQQQLAWGSEDCPIGGGRTLLVADQNEALAQAQGAWYLSIVLCQLFNLFACKTLFTSPFRRYIFKNKQTFKTVVAGLVFAFGIVYLPGVSTAFGVSSRLNPLFLLIPVGFGILVYLYSGLRFWIKLRLSPIKFAHEPLGLKMHATRYSYL